MKDRDGADGDALLCDDLSEELERDPGVLRKSSRNRGIGRRLVTLKSS
jgi:hypothetical protein